MRKGTFAIIIVILVVVIAIIGAGMLGFINLGSLLNIKNNNDPTYPGNANVSGEYTNLGLSDMEFHQIMCMLTNRSPPFEQHRTFIQGLHMTAYGIDETTAYGVHQDYKEDMTEDGFVSYDEGVTYGPGYTAYAEVWYNDEYMGRSIVVGDGSSVISMYGYDVVLLTGYGPITDYYQYVLFLNSY